MGNFTKDQVVRGTLEPEINYNAQDDTDNPAVRDCLKLLTENFTEKNAQDTKNDQVLDLIEAGFEIREPNGPRVINSKKLIQVYWKIVNKLKPLDFHFHGTNRPEHMEDLVTEGMGTVLKKGGYASSFRDKGGTASNLVAFGDAFRLIGARGEKGFPVEFTTALNSNIYVNVEATGFRSGAKPVRKCAVVFSGTWAEFVALFPGGAKIATVGEIPRDISQLKETDQSTWQQLQRGNADLIEWCYYYDLDNLSYTLFAGSKCSILKQENGDAYPFRFKDEEGRDVPYIPVSHYMCLPSLRGFYNHSVFSMVYDLAILYQQIFNELSGYVRENVNPIELVNLPREEADKFFGKMAAAYRMRAEGKRAFVPIEYDATGQGSVSSQSLIRQGLINEAIALFDRIDLEIKRLGVHLDEIESAQATATQILSDQERADQFVAQIMEFNASEVEMELLIAQDLVKKAVAKNDKTPLHITTSIEVDGVEVKGGAFTLGQLKDELSKHEYFPRVNSRSGAIPSNTMRRAQLMQVLPLLQSYPDAQARVIKALTGLNEVDVGALAPPASPEMPSAAEMPNGESLPQELNI